MTAWKRLSSTSSDPSILLIRLMVGSVFLSEGIQKFLFPYLRGSGRFEKIGLPAPDFLGNMVGSFEILCAAFILIGFLTRIAAVPLITIMIVAITITKLPILKQDDVWQMLHACRTDWCMLLGSIFLLWKGGGKWSLDARLFR
ncbi:MAG: DoxX family protein [Saprospiraceae bacterium]|nr:DoxX family protein [Saprospiraceae bacterium]